MKGLQFALQANQCFFTKSKQNNIVLVAKPGIHWSFDLQVHSSGPHVLSAANGGKRKNTLSLILMININNPLDIAPQEQESLLGILGSN